MLVVEERQNLHLAAQVERLAKVLDMGGIPLHIAAVGRNRIGRQPSLGHKVGIKAVD